ncbi:MAG: NADH-quinone oxidoreductase subunit NuoE [Halodesulfurarchaeum sp.]
MSSGSHNGAAIGEDVQSVALQRSLSHLERDATAVLPALQAVQNAFGYLPESALEYVAAEFDTPLSQVVGIATFYEQFALEPQGEHTIRVCTGTACHVNGSADVLDTYRQELGVNPGEVTEDGTYTLAEVRCVGACSLAPVVMIDDETFADVNPDDAMALLEEDE